MIDGSIGGRINLWTDTDQPTPRNATVVFRNDGERDSFRFWKQKKPQLISALRGIGPLELQNTKNQLAMSIIWREEIDLRFVQLRKNQKLQTLFWNATERVRFKFPGT